jgi:hypothetical protein
MWRESGKAFCVQFLKEVLRLLQHYIAGERNLTPIGIRISLKYDLPAIIPGPLRYHIARENQMIIRGVLTLISVFRVMKIPGKIKLNTITDPFQGYNESLSFMVIAKVMRERFIPLISKPISKFVKHDLLVLTSAGPNYGTSCLGASLDAKAFSENPNLLNSYIKLGNLLGSKLPELLLKEISIVKSTKSKIVESKELILGKLSIKEEAAGKVRVFAIVDVWTQSLLVSIHEFIFSFLKDIAQDGTFNQARPIDELMERVKDMKDKRSYSFDLSAATDRLPVQLQTDILSKILGSEISNAWRSLLVDREYHLNSKIYGNHKLTYSVGQPMGALSSWALLALTHHFIVQLAAQRSGFNSWFRDYALLGDDIVIVNTSVATEYQFLMKELGLEINLSKSLISEKGVFEFAKRVVTPNGEVTPLGPKNLVWAIKHPSMLVSLFLDLEGKGFELTDDLVKSLVNNVLKLPIPLHKKSVEKLLWMIMGPFGVQKHTNAISSVKIDMELKKYDNYEVLESCKRVVLDLQTRLIKSAVLKAEASMDKFVLTTVYEDWWGISKFHSPAMLSIAKSLAEDYSLLTKKDHQLGDPILDKLMRVSTYNGTGDAGSFLTPLFEAAYSINPLVSPGQVVKPKLPQLRDNNFKFYNKVLKILRSNVLMRRYYIPIAYAGSEW